MKLKQVLSSSLRKLNILDKVDTLRFYILYVKNYAQISSAQKKYSDFNFPPPYYIFETYHLNYEDYYLDGKQTATEILAFLAQYADIQKHHFSILDWGCGPARVIRHIANILPNSKAVGSDYNKEYIDWGKKKYT